MVLPRRNDMPVLNTKLTDKQLSDLYAGLMKSYKDNPRLPVRLLWERVGCDLDAKMSMNGEYSQLLPVEKEKVFNVLATFMMATPKWRGVPEMERLPVQPDRFRAPINPQRFAQQPIVIVQPVYYTRSNFDDYLFWYWLRSSDSLNNSHTHYKNKTGEEIVNTVAFLIAATVFLVALYYATFYLLNVILDSIERFSNNEGFLYASISIVSAMIGAIASAALVITMLNPVGVLAMLGVVGASIISASAVSYLTNSIQNFAVSRVNKDALDPNDPYRYLLTEKAVGHMNIENEQIKLDPIKVKCAIVALRAEIDNMPSAYVRFFKRSDEKTARINENLNLIRQLRRGELTLVKVGDMEFDLCLNTPAQGCAVAANDAGAQVNGVVQGTKVCN